MVERLLRQIVRDGIRRVTVITGWCGAMVTDHLQKLDRLPADLELTFVAEEAPLGNAGALLQMDLGDDPVVFVFADIVTNIQFKKLLEKHESTPRDVTLCSHIERYKLRLGELITNGSRVREYLEKPQKEHRICSGISVFERDVLASCTLEPGIGIAELVNDAIVRGLRVEHWDHGAWWIDVNTVDALDQAEKEMGHYGIE